MKTSNELQKTDVNEEPIQQHVNLLFQKTTADDDDDDDHHHHHHHHGDSLYMDLNHGCMSFSLRVRGFCPRTAK